MISKEKYESMEFTSFGFDTYENKEKQAYRLPDGFEFSGRSNFEVRGMISNLLHDEQERRGKSITHILELECAIPYPTYRQYISGKNRRPSRQFIAKLCVGLKLPIEKANELFAAHSGELNLTNNVDAITYYALLDKDSIEDYEQELFEKVGEKI